jgi:DNA-binding transcriptional LysR family regulator
MTLEQLRIFVAVAEREHITRAAEALRLTQSAVSAAVSALEERHEVKLFDRVGRRIALTPAGRLFLGEARSVLARAAAAEAALADLAGLKRGALALAASQTVGNYWLPPLLAAFRAAHPGIALSLAIGNTETAVHLVRDGAADLGFVEGAVEDPALRADPVAEDELVVVAPPALAGRSDFADLPWVMRERGSGTRALIDHALAEAGFGPVVPVLELPSNESVRTAVQAGAGIAALSRIVVARALASGSLIALPFAPPKRRFSKIRLKERSATHAERALDRLIADGR